MLKWIVLGVGCLMLLDLILLLDLITLLMAKTTTDGLLMIMGM